MDAAAANACQVARQLKTLASDVNNRETIGKDKSVVPGLVLFLGNDSNDVVILALETLHLLAECASNRPHMRDELGMLVSLEAIMNRTNYNSKAQHLARDLYNTLTSSSQQQRGGHHHQNPLKDSQYKNTHGGKVSSSTSKPGTPSCSRSGRTYVRGGNKKSKSKQVILQLKGFTDVSCRKLCEDELLQVKGVFSFTFDLHKKRCMLRTKPDIQPEVLVAAIARTKTISAEQVVKNEYGEEVMLSFGANPAAANKENDSLPDYLPEDDSPVKDKAVRLHGQEQQEGGGWLSAAANLISTSFYW